MKKITWDILSGVIGAENIETLENTFLEWNKNDMLIIYRRIIQWDDNLFGFDVMYDPTGRPVDTTDLFKVTRVSYTSERYEKAVD